MPRRYFGHSGGRKPWQQIATPIQLEVLIVMTLSVGVNVKMPTYEEMDQIAVDVQSSHAGEKLTIENAIGLTEEIKQAISGRMELYLTDHSGRRIA
jgi:hypothetical protein